MERSAGKRKPDEIKNIVEKVLGQIEQTGKAEGEDIAATWEAAVGRRAARHAQPVSLRNNILTVAVDNSAWLYQLTTQKRGLLESLKLKLAQGLADIKFRIK